MLITTIMRRVSDNSSSVQKKDLSISVIPCLHARDFLCVCRYHGLGDEGAVWSKPVTVGAYPSVIPIRSQTPARDHFSEK